MRSYLQKKPESSKLFNFLKFSLNNYGHMLIIYKGGLLLKPETLVKRFGPYAGRKPGTAGPGITKRIVFHLKGA
jgi:hypothetical protein